MYTKDILEQTIDVLCFLMKTQTKHIQNQMRRQKYYLLKSTNENNSTYEKCIVSG